MSIKESNRKKNYSTGSDKNKKVASTKFYLRNLLRDRFSKTDQIQKRLKIKKINVLKGRELSTDFKKKT